MLAVPPGQLNKFGRLPVRIFPAAEEMFETLARFTADFIKQHPEATIIFPVGPKKHFPRLAELVNGVPEGWRASQYVDEKKVQTPTPEDLRIENGTIVMQGPEKMSSA